MHEQSSRFSALEEILDHPANRDRDAHERHALYRRMHMKNFAELTRERWKIAARNYE
jgi:hypothetical protein